MNGNFEAELQDLLDFAEDILQSPLQQWQREILSCLFRGQTYIAPRTGGKQIMSNIFQKWYNAPRRNAEPCDIYDIQYTYEQLMAGELT